MARYYKKGRLTLLFLLLILTGCSVSPGGTVIQQQESMSAEKESSEEESGETAGREISKQKIWVHVCGEVNHPGVYELEAASRVIDAIEAAGGFTKQADEEALNLAEALSDASQIQVLSRKETAKKEKKEQGEAAEGQNADGRVDLNTATLEELMTLPGIGEKRAQAILMLRKQKGTFQKIDELMEAEGIKEGIFQKIKDLIKV